MSHAKDSITIDEENQIMDALDVWLSKEVAPHVRELEHEDIYPTEIVQQMREMGLFSLMYSPEHGGLGFSASSYTKVITRLSETWMSLPA